MTIMHPEVFWLFFVLVPLMYIFLRNYFEGKKTVRTIGGQWRARRFYNVYLVKWFFSAFFFILFTVSCILAMAGISWGKKSIQEDTQGMELVFVVDVSRSMLAQDLDPSRLDRAGEFIQGMIRELENARFGIVIFKGEAETIIPMTEDNVVISTFTDYLSPGLMSTPGTNVESGLQKALESFPQKTPSQRIIVLITDGETLSGKPLKIVEKAKKEGVPIFTVGAGTDEGALIILTNGKPVIDQNGNPVITRLNSSVLEELSVKTGGSYFYLTNVQILTELTATIHRYVKTKENEGFRLISVKRYPLFILLAFCFLSIHLLIRIVRWRNIL